MYRRFFHSGSFLKGTAPHLFLLRRLPDEEDLPHGIQRTQFQGDNEAGRGLDLDPKIAPVEQAPEDGATNAVQVEDENLVTDIRLRVVGDHQKGAVLETGFENLSKKRRKAPSFRAVRMSKNVIADLGVRSVKGLTRLCRKGNATGPVRCSTSKTHDALQNVRRNPSQKCRVCVPSGFDFLFKGNICLSEPNIRPGTLTG